MSPPWQRASAAPSPAAAGRDALTARAHFPMLRFNGGPDMLLNWLLIIAGALCVLTEVAMGGFAGFDLVLVGSAVTLGGFIGLVVGNSVVGLTVAAALSLLYIAVGRRWVRAHLRHATVESNADALVGQSALVLKRVAEHQPGQVKV